MKIWTDAGLSAGVAIVVAVVLCSAASAQQAPTAVGGDRGNELHGSPYTPVHEFDPKRDANADLQSAIAEAQRTNRRIILDIGGNWCQFCHQMDQMFRDNPDLVKLRDENFVTLAVYYGAENKNHEFLAHYSRVLGIPHFFVLEKDGTLIFSEHVRDLRLDGKYDPAKMKDFLLKWSPHSER